jgi:hypothetical protein
LSACIGNPYEAKGRVTDRRIVSFRIREDQSAIKGRERGADTTESFSRRDASIPERRHQGAVQGVRSPRVGESLLFPDRSRFQYFSIFILGEFWKTWPSIKTFTRFQFGTKANIDYRAQ